MIVSATARFTSREDAGRFVSNVITPAAIQAVTESVERVLSDARLIVPVKTGALRDSGKTTVVEGRSSVTGHVVFDANHAGYVEYGTGVRGAGSAGVGPFAYNLNWSGMPAQPYLRPALDQNRETIRQTIKGAISLAVNE